MKTKPVIYSAVNLIIAAIAYWHLSSGGWLNYHYRLGDLNIVNLLLAVAEPIPVLLVIAYWVWRTAILYRLLFASFVLQLLIISGCLVFVLYFMFSWSPRLM